MDKGALSHLARAGSQITVRVTPRAARNRIVVTEGEIRIYVTTIPEGGKATAAVARILARSLGIPKSRLTLLRGATSRGKVFRIEP